MNTDIFEDLVKNDYKIFVDTSSLMQEDSEKVFYMIVAPLLYKYERRLIIPKSVLNEIKKHNDMNHPDIKKANQILNHLAEYKLWGTNSKFDEQFADNAMTAQFHSLRLKYNLCLITNDNSHKKDGNLSQDILDLKKSRSSEKIKDIKVFFIKNKNLHEFKDRNEVNNEQTNSFESKDECFQFNLPTVPQKNDRQLNPIVIPESGSFVYDQKGKKHKLLKQIGRTGGEGSVYLTDSNYICKIYKKEKVTKFRVEKIIALIKHSIRIENVCLPQLIIYNSSKEFVGYLMSEAIGSDIKTSILIGERFGEKFPTWNRSHLAKISLNILKKVEQLHKYNIILGDINPSNILFKDENNIFLIDTDSFQIEGYPSSVGLPLYTRKKHHGIRYEDYLRTKEDDVFAIATIIFQIMLLGKPPYSFSGGSGEQENMKPENFPYKCDDVGYKNAPDGNWVYIWSHLPFKLKQLFCRIFKKDEDVFLNEFIQQMESYIYQLEQGHQSIEIFPLTYKQIDDNGKVLQDDFLELKCKMCNSLFAIPNRQVSEYKEKKWDLPSKCNICKDIKDYEVKKCLKCSKEFKDKDNVYCKQCRGVDITCKSCFSSFFFTEGEKMFYDEKGLDYPKKCKKCKNN